MRPYKVLLFIAACLCVLAILCVALPHRLVIGSRTLHWPTLAEVFEVNKPASVATTDTIADFDETEELTVVVDTITPVDTTPTPKTICEPIPVVQVDTTSDSRIFLRAFYASLQQTSERKVRIIHYGDSQIEEDRMSQQIREKMQARYGGAGVGLMPLAQTIPSRTVKQELIMDGRTVSPQRAVKRNLVYGPKRDQRSDGLYGVMGQVAIMNDSLVKGSESITTICTPLDAGPRYSCVKVFADTGIHYTRSGDTIFLNGRGAVYGLSQESATGVIVDNIPMRGCMGNVFTRISASQLQRFYADENVRLIIMQFGGNAIPSNEKATTIQAIVAGLREQVRYLHRCAPEASILFIGPSDMLTTIDGELQTYPMVPYMDRLLRKMAKEEQIAYFSLFQWMGGSGSMKRWQEVGLAGSDGVHFMRSGARKAGNAVADWILEGESIVFSD
ncbi:MAG: hypothetical protein II928_00260 [Paludibacteraceae bacterium]|nr:hypothetical protein [Paludibacteraceae bacterium]